MKRVISILILLMVALPLPACEFLEPDPYQFYTQQERKGIIPPPIDGQETIEEQVVFDQDGIKATVLALRVYPQYNDIRFYMLIENNTDYDILVQTRDNSINGIMVTPLFSKYVEAGRMLQDYIKFAYDPYGKFSDLGITEVYEYEFKLFVRDIYTRAADATISDTITIRTSAYGGEQLCDDEGLEIFNEGGIRVVEQGFLTTNYDYLGPDIILFTENYSDRDICVALWSISVNGHRVTATGYTAEVMAGKRSYDTLSIAARDLEEYGITTIEEVEIVLWVYDYVTRWDNLEELYRSDVITLTYDYTPVPRDEWWDFIIPREEPEE